MISTHLISPPEHRHGVTAWPAAAQPKPPSAQATTGSVLKAAPPSHRRPWPSVLAWPAWARALAVAPALVLLWVGVAWAMTTVAPL